MSELLDTAPGSLGKAAPGSAKWLTTGEAADLCGVAPDTVLRWIKKGKLPAERTPGGHHRIPIEAVERLAIPSAKAPSEEALPRTRLYCWQYFARNGEPCEECRRCIVHRSRAEWCFRLVDNPTCGHSRRYLRGSCQECAYYRRVHRLPADVLVITTDASFIEELKSGGAGGVRCHFAVNAYEASAAVEAFHPEFAIIDWSLPNGEREELLRCLAHDSRIPGLRVILAVRSLVTLTRPPVREDGLVAGVLRKPFGADAVQAVIDRIPVPQPPPKDEAAPACPG